MEEKETLTLTQEDIFELKEFISAKEDIDMNPSGMLTPEEWNDPELQDAMRTDGDIPGQYEFRLGKETKVIYNIPQKDGTIRHLEKGIPLTRYYDIAADSRDKEIRSLEKKYAKFLLKAKIFFLQQIKDGNIPFEDYKNKFRLATEEKIDDSGRTTVREERRLYIIDIIQDIVRLAEEAFPQEIAEEFVALAKEKGFYNLPTSPAINLFLELMIHPNSSKFIAQKQKSNHSQKIEVSESGEKRQIKAEGNYSSVTLELSDINKLAGTNTPAKKMFVFALIKINEQAFSGGILRRNFVQFPLQELIDIGSYSVPKSARKGFLTAMDTLTSIKVSGEIRKGEKTVKQSKIEVLFTGAEIKNGSCTIFINERINWNFITSFYTVLPDYYFALPNRASDLLLYIFYIARQRLNDIKNKGYFTISFRAIQERLNLPSENKNPNPNRTIRQPIEDAITAIKDANKNPDFAITSICNPKDPIASYLNCGYLKISFKGKYSENFISLSKNIESLKQLEERQTEKEHSTREKEHSTREKEHSTQG